VRYCFRRGKEWEAAFTSDSSTKAVPNTGTGNNGFVSHRTHIVVFQDYFIKWSMVYPVPDQMAMRIVELLTKEVIPFCGVPEAVLTDSGTNLLSHLMLDVLF